MLDRFKKSIEMNCQYQYSFYENDKTSALPHIRSSAWTALVKLFRKDWFFRVWVIQEVVNARKVSVACGSLSVSWEVIVQVSRACQKIGYLGSYTIEGYAPGTDSAIVIDSLKRSKVEANMIELLRRTRTYKASNERDKVFALKGIAIDGQGYSVVDYSLSPEQIFRSVAIHSLSELKSLACLSSAGLRSPPLKLTLPTWVPDWTHNNDNRSVLGTGSRFSAAGSSTPSLKISADESTLIIDGYLIDTITHINSGLRRVQDANVDCNPAALSQQERDLQGIRAHYRDAMG
jgi:hypothetical protein